MNTMTEIVDHMRIFTRRSDGTNKRTVDLNDLLERTLVFLEHQLADQDIRLTRQLEEGLPVIVGDPIQLEQVFLNMINNARSAQEGSEKDDRHVAVKTYRQGGEERTQGASIVVEISDNGVGIPPGEETRVFREFHRAPRPEGGGGRGSGLGLALCRRIVRLHGGSIRIERTSPEGTTFEVRLPRGATRPRR